MNREDVIGSEEEEVEEMEVEEEGGGWDDLGSDGDDSEPEIKCLFCALSCRSAGDLFGHCSSVHSFDFHALRKLFGLDFYSSFKLINFIRSQVRIFCVPCLFVMLSTKVSCECEAMVTNQVLLFVMEVE